LKAQIAELDKEMRPLKKLILGPVTTPKDLLMAARAAARQSLEQTRVGRINPKLEPKQEGSTRLPPLSTFHSRAAGKASLSAQQKMKSAADRLNVIRHKQDQLLHEATAAEAVKAEREVEKGLRRMKAIADVSRKNLKNHEFDYIYVARLLLGKFFEMQDAPIETGIDQELRLQALGRVFMEDADLGQRVVSILERDMGALANVTLQDFREIQNVLVALQEQGSILKREGSLLKGKTLEETQGIVLDTVSKWAPAQKERGAMTDAENRKHGILGSVFKLRRLEHWLAGLEGQDGFIQRTLFRPILKAAYKSRLESNRVRKELFDMMKALDPQRGKIVSQKLDYTFGRNGTPAILEILMVMLNTGNASNYARMLTGMGWADTDQNGDIILDPETGQPMDTKFRSAIADMVKDGTLNEQHFAFLQATWDLMADTFTHAQRTHLSVTGTVMKLVQPEQRTWTMADGKQVTLKGGYVPIRYRNVGAAVAEDQTTVANQMGESTSSLVPTVQNSFTKERVKEFTAELRFDEMSLFKHLDDIIRYAHVQRPLMDTLRVLGLTSRQQTPVRLLLEGMPGNPMVNMILPWLNDVATQTTTKRDSTPQWITNGVNFLRRNSAMNALFASIPNTMQQLTGLFVTGSKLKNKGNLWRAIKGYASGRYDEVRNTDMMRSRLDTKMREWELSLEEMRIGRSTLKSMQSWMARNVYWMQSKLQNVVDIVSWDAAYTDFLEQKRPDGITEEAWVQQARDHADSIVRQTQGSFNPEDLSAMERGSVWMKLGTQFTSYFNMMANLNGAELERTLREFGWKGAFKKELWVQYAWGFLLPVLVSDAIARAFYGDWEDEPDEAAESLTDFFVLSQVRALAGAVPFLGQVVPAAIGRFTDTPLDDRMRLPPLIDFAVNRLKDIPKSTVDTLSGEADKYDLTNLATFLTLGSGLPIQTVMGRPGNMVYRSLTDPDVELFTPGAGAGERAFEALDAARFLVTGKASPAQER
jgi:hypothetical protein